MYLEKDEMKFAIIYTLRKNIAPMGMEVLCEVLTWEKEVMGYFELASMLSELIEDGYVERTHYRNRESFMLTSKGNDTYSFFAERVPRSIRRRIDSAIGEQKFDEQVNPNAVIAEVMPFGRGEHIVRLEILEDNKLIFELEINMPTLAEADKAAAALKANSDDVYSAVVKIIESGGN